MEVGSWEMPDDMEEELDKIYQEYAKLRQESPFIIDQSGVVNTHLQRMATIEQKRTEVQLTISELSARGEALQQLRFSCLTCASCRPV